MKQANCRGIANHIVITSGTQLQLSVSAHTYSNGLEAIIPPVTNTKYYIVYTIVKIYHFNTTQLQYHAIQYNTIAIPCNTIQYLVSLAHHVVVQDIAKILHQREGGSVCACACACVFTLLSDEAAHTLRAGITCHMTATIFDVTVT